MQVATRHDRFVRQDYMLLKEEGIHALILIGRRMRRQRGNHCSNNTASSLAIILTRRKR
jgi:hypothetical protein